jgi:tetratricopeptide (TPR) repeat protein
MPTRDRNRPFHAATRYAWLPHSLTKAFALRIFISAVTSEFGKARDQLAADLRARGHHVTIQSDFQQRPDNATLLGTLSDYIHDCHTVICIVGTRSGASPPKAATDRFPYVLPAGVPEASYTQWEFFLARYLKRRPYLYVASDDYEPDRDKPTDGDRPELQSAFRRHLTDQGVHYGLFSNVDQLARAVLRDEPRITDDPAPGRPTIAKPIVLPYPSIGKLFKGRDEFVQRLRETFTGRGRTAVTSQVLHGLGGVGKSRVAVEYAWTHANDYNALLFAIADTPEALRRSLARLSGTLVPTLNTTEDEVRLKASLDWLNTNPSWFLILDNVDTPAALAAAELLLSQLRSGHVVVTSRLANFPAHIEPIELDLLTVKDAADFLVDRTRDRRRVAADDDVKAREVAEELGRLALALEHAGAYIAKHRLTFGEYLERWRSQRGDVLNWFDATVTSYPRAVAVTWQTSVTQLSEPGRHLLQRLAWLAPEKIPETLLDVAIPGIENVRDALVDLSAYSLAIRDAEGPFFIVHRLVQDMTRGNLTGSTRQRSLTEALNWISAAFDGNTIDVRNWPRLDPLAPHANAVARHADDAGIPDPTAGLMDQLGLLFDAKALHSQAEPLMRRALAITEASLGADHPTVSIRLNNLAQLLRATDRFAEAEPLLRRALVIDENSFGRDHPKIAPSLKNLAQLLKATNRLGEAEPLMFRAWAIDEKNLGPNHPDVASDLGNLAQLLQATGRFTECEPLMRHVLAITEASLGPTDPQVATALSNLGSFLFQHTERRAEAEHLLRRALAINEVSYGLDHPSVAVTLNNLAQFLKATNRLPEAEPLMRRALAIIEACLGPNHSDVAIRLNNLAQLLQADKKFKEAEPLMQRALAITEASLGADHPDVAQRLNNLAGLMFLTARLSEAEPLMRRALAIYMEFGRQTGHQHPSLNTAYENYTGLLKVMGKSTAEIEAALKALPRKS